MLASFPDLDSSDKGLMTAYLAKPFNSKITKERLNYLSRNWNQPIDSISER